MMGSLSDIEAEGERTSGLSEWKLLCVCFPGDRTGVCQWADNRDQKPENRTEPDDRGAGGSAEGQGGGMMESRPPETNHH